MNNVEKSIDTVTKTDEDAELADLLDSALEDFKKDAKKTNNINENDGQKSSSATEQASDSTTDIEWSEEFIRQAAEQFESNIANILKDVGGPELTSEKMQKSFQQMAEAAAQVTINSGEAACSDADFASSISQALKGLSEGTENLQNPFSDQDLANMFSQQDSDQNAFVPFMQGMMQSLLSKEVLYPSLKDILDKYPAWLEANGGSLSAEERHRYEQQQDLMKQVCEQLEKESENDTTEKKKKQFDAVLELMQKLQDYGQPPAELVGDLGPGVQFDPQGVPELNQCRTM